MVGSTRVTPLIESEMTQDKPLLILLPLTVSSANENLLFDHEVTAIPPEPKPKTV